MVRIFGKKYEDDVERYYREIRKKELEQSKNSNRDGSDYEVGILEYIRIEDREVVGSPAMARKRKQILGTQILSRVIPRSMISCPMR